MAKDSEMKCVTLMGILEDEGIHILMPFGTTLCGMPTVDCDKEKFPALKEKTFDDMIFDYKEEKPDSEISCKRCIEIYEILLNRSKDLN